MTTPHRYEVVEVGNDSGHQPTAGFCLGAIAFAGPALDALHADLMNLQPAHPNPSQDAIALKQVITLNQIKYRYPKAPHPALKNLSLTIPAKSTVGLVGATGSGKITTVDLILGLLEAHKGTMADYYRTQPPRMARRHWLCTAADLSG